ncbi:class I SAM-dependent methyltransferase [Thermodesulfobacterium thermophilum]|uniref:class I SAM-dependent methyltransferase n=1 Tax=Thermodesulfobacterium thermophilum TaxID=886 RepID=UPI0030ED3ED9
MAKRTLGVDTIYAMSLEEFYEFARERNLKFDVITFFEVLEHQDRPMDFLRMVRELLKEGGYMAGSVPNRESFFAEILIRKDSLIDYPPHHFLRFSHKALENALKLAGFRDIKVFQPDFPRKEIYLFVEKKLFGNLDNKYNINLS